MSFPNTRTLENVFAREEGEAMAKKIADEMAAQQQPEGEKTELPSIDDLVALIKDLSAKRDQIIKDAKAKETEMNAKISALKKQLQKMVGSL